ncbi:hypothetical protein [Allomuricauda sp. d1]|uniref:hypothetical protein n=1 Tax=Allomuricauda sp. d1 TaxID=3136725 RepID=UPI0031CF08E5
MNVDDFIDILRKSETVLSPGQTRELEHIIEEYPYFQTVRALHLKGLKNLNSHKYNNALKVTAAYTSDREVLFDYITSENFDQHQIADTIAGRIPNLNEKKVVSEEVEPNPEANVILGESEESGLPQNIKQAEQILSPKLFDNKEPIEVDDAKKVLDLGSPISFTKNEKHSFAEWLQLTSKKPVKKEAENPERKKKFELLDKFIEKNPKIVPSEKIKAKVNIKESTKINKDELMTETLAKVYLEQKKYKKAIQAFKILSLKYPEKSGFFADQIRAVQQLQEENKS